MNATIRSLNGREIIETSHSRILLCDNRPLAGVLFESGNWKAYHLDKSTLSEREAWYVEEFLSEYWNSPSGYVCNASKLAI